MHGMRVPVILDGASVPMRGLTGDSSDSTPGSESSFEGVARFCSNEDGVRSVVNGSELWGLGSGVWRRR